MTWKNEKKWDAYQDAYQDVLNKTSTAWAPWYAIPANRNWYRNLCVSSIITDALRSLKLKYPDPLPNPEMYIQALVNESAEN
jgi:polyphosphate kinase 2 (PPK2 family)